MTEAAPITTQVVKHQFVLEENPENEEQRKTPWQRFCASCNNFCENFTDCLNFWCCKNECYELCCNIKDVDSDEEVAFGNFEVVDDQAAMTVFDSDNQEVNTYGDANEHSEIEPRGDHGDSHQVVSGGGDLTESHRGGDRSGGQHKEDHSGDQNVGVGSGGHHKEDHSGDHNIGSGSGGHHNEENSGDHNVGSGSGGHHAEDHSGGGNDGGGDSTNDNGGDCGGGNDGGGDCGGGDD